MRLLILYFILFITCNKLFPQYTWIKSTLPDSIEAYSIDFDTTGKQYVATNYGIYSSISGEFWERTSYTEPTALIYINNNNTFYTGAIKLSRSFDCGATWDSIFYNSQGGIISLYTIGDSCIFFGTWGGLYRTVDSANTWTKPIDTLNIEVFKAINSTSDNILFAGSKSYDFPGYGLYKSDDLGLTWYPSNLDYHFVQTIVINSNDEIFVGTEGHYYNATGLILKSSDKGDTWEIIRESSLIASMDINSYDELTYGRSYYNGGGVYYSNDGSDWENVTTNLDYPYIWQVKFSPNNRLFAITIHEYKLYHTTDIVELENDFNTQNTSIEILPNPADNWITIKYLRNDKINKVTIYNTEGQVVYNNFELNERIDITEFVSGIYVVEIETLKNRSRKKLILK